MKKIILRNSNLFCLIDDGDFSLVSKYKWYLNHKGYAQRNRRQQNFVKDKLPILMHCLIIGQRYGLTTDHINGNKLDNQKENLRFISNTNNIRRRGKQKNSTTGYKGVYFYKSKNLKPTTIRYWSGIRVNKKLVFIGYFSDKIEAVTAYNNASKKYHGDYGYQNTI
jgi:hypothetical protein